jgi:hypothetical protein
MNAHIHMNLVKTTPFLHGLAKSLQLGAIRVWCPGATSNSWSLITTGWLQPHDTRQYSTMKFTRQVLLESELSLYSLENAEDPAKTSEGDPLLIGGNQGPGNQGVRNPGIREKSARLNTAEKVSKIKAKTSSFYCSLRSLVT